MSEMDMPEFPTRPRSVPEGVSLLAVAEAFHVHLGLLVHARYGIGERLNRDRLARHALGALACQHALAERALCGRWSNAADALRYGAALAQVAEAMGLTVGEVGWALRRWADGQVRTGGLAPTERAELYALLDGDTESGAGPRR